MIPKGWKRKSLGEIAEISSGSTPLRQKDEYWNGNIPWVTTGEIDYQVIDSTKEKITELACKECSLKVYPPGTILMAMYGQGITRGRIALLGINATTNQACCAISLDSKSDVQFIYFQLENLYSKIRKLGHGGNQQNLNGQIIKQIPILSPPLPEQRKIAEILGVWDVAIDLLEKLITAKRKLKQGLMQQLLTGKKRFKEFEGSKLKTIKLSQLAKISSGGTPPSSNLSFYGGNIYWTSISDMTSSGKYLCDTERKLTDLGLQNSSAKIFPVGTILFAMYASIGKCSISKVSAASSQAILGIQVNNNLVNTEFVYYFLTSQENKYSLMGQHGTQKNLNASMVKNFDIPLLSLSEQERIASVLSTTDDEISTLEKQLTAYKQQKHGLMQQLLTGRKRIDLN